MGYSLRPKYERLRFGLTIAAKYQIAVIRC